MSEWMDVPVAEVAVGDEVKVDGIGENVATGGALESYASAWWLVRELPGEHVTLLADITAGFRRSSIVAVRRRKPEPQPKPGDWRHGAPQIPNVAHTPDGCYSVPAVPQGSEPPIDPLQTLDAQLWAKEFMRIWSKRWAEVDEALMIAWFANAIMRGFDESSAISRPEIESLKAERDALKAELDHLKHGIPLTYNPNTMCRDGHVMVLYVSEFEPCPMCALKARVEELEGAIVDATQRANYSAWIVLDDMANAIRARKEASNGK